MRIILLFSVLAFGTVIGTNVITSVSEMQDARMEQFCQIDAKYCK